MIDEWIKFIEKQKKKMGMKKKVAKVEWEKKRPFFFHFSQSFLSFF